MALPQNAIRLMELRSAALSKLLTDSVTSPTYSTKIPLVGAVKIKVSPKVESKKLQGDSVLLDLYQRIMEVELDIEIATLSLDALAVLQGGASTATGTTPNQKTVYALTSDNVGGSFFKLEGQWTYAGEGVGDAHFVIYKAKITDAPPLELNDASGDFGKVSFKALALPCISNKSWYDIVLNETATAIA